MCQFVQSTSSPHQPPCVIHIVSMSSYNPSMSSSILPHHFSVTFHMSSIHLPHQHSYNHITLPRQHLYCHVTAQSPTALASVFPNYYPITFHVSSIWLPCQRSLQPCVASVQCHVSPLYGTTCHFFIGPNNPLKKSK
jgi:hypothetical protein